MDKVVVVVADEARGIALLALQDNHALWSNDTLHDHTCYTNTNIYESNSSTTMLDLTDSLNLIFSISVNLDTIYS